MRKLLLFLTVALILFGIGGVLILKLSIKSDVKANIQLAQQKYAGTPEEALIAFLEDDSNSKVEQTHIAVWTLGQIESEKALSILQRYYKEDPEGETCYKNHHLVLFQYELYKAIQAIEKGNFFSFANLK
jgi:hypothetical protein